MRSSLATTSTAPTLEKSHPEVKEVKGMIKLMSESPAATFWMNWQLALTEPEYTLKVKVVARSEVTWARMEVAPLLRKFTEPRPAGFKVKLPSMPSYWHVDRPEPLFGVDDWKKPEATPAEMMMFGVPVKKISCRSRSPPRMLLAEVEEVSTTGYTVASSDWMRRLFVWTVKSSTTRISPKVTILGRLEGVSAMEGVVEGVTDGVTGPYTLTTFTRTSTF